MKKILLPILAAALVWANGAAACEEAEHVARVAYAVSDCAGKVVELTAMPVPEMPELSGIVELTTSLEAIELKELELTARVHAFESETETASRSNVAVTIAKALGKAFLKVVAAVIHAVVV